MSASDFDRRAATGHILVGYVATDYGKDALRLGIALAKTRNVNLEIVMAAPANNSFSGVYPHDRGYSSILEEQIAGWLQEALGEIPSDIRATARIVPGESEAEALNRAAEELDCDMIVVGARKGGLFGRFQMGTAVNTLLHSGTVPIALAPHGYSYPGPISRITAMFGPRPGTTDVIAIGLDRARRRRIPLRLLSLVLPGESDLHGLGTDVPNAVRAYANRKLGDIAEEMLSAGYATTDVATGRDVEAAMENVTWQDGELAVVGSSRLAVPGRLFLGGTASRMLRSIPVPMVVVPAGYMHAGAEHEAI
ncbi:universal stress protein [Corynebacterium simulans]|uniref:universal stress protein n=1 Tax=Corynebacterium TaxID=1716 RepID=UPI0008A2A883|nr:MULTISPECIES: universal stress protein [Corynebacterium]MDK7139548.1 universal stress protein [Corynebacterium simulans]OFQ46203.1 universal stress protein [Corynebacterium sp. HMSC076D02]